MAKTVHIMLLALQLVVSMSVVLSARRIPPQKCRMTNLACDYDKALVTDVVCRFKATRTTFGIFNIGLTILKPTDNITIAVESYYKNSANRWLTGVVHLKVDVCNLMGSKREVFIGVINKIYGTIPDILHACPYEGRVEVSNFTIQTVDHLLSYFPGLPSGEYKYVATFYHGVNKSMGFELSISEYCKLDTLNPTWM